jgi:nucleotide-binding universal stress UspA family protein
LYKHLLLPTDGSRLSTKGVGQGVALAQAVGARVTVLNVAPQFEMVVDEGFVLPNVTALKKRFDEQTAKQAKKIVDTAAQEAKAARVKCETVIDRSLRPFEAILQHAKKGKCDLIVMSSHGRTGLASLLLGSETSKVLTHSKIPVLIVR